MGERIDQLASTFEKSSAVFTTLVEGLNDAQWRTPVPGENRTVGVVAHHIAVSLTPTAGAVGMVASGQGLPLTMDMIDQMAVDHVQKHANVTKAETVALLKENTKAAAGMLRGLTDADLDKSGPVAAMGGQSVPAGQFAQYVVLGHIADHTKNIKATLGI